ncbi:cohesin complex subunit SCC1 [Nematocida sp. AWRm80]|nr:cohesin complex subunit SCC1 [Nematocida sp. AWRm80]
MFYSVEVLSRKGALSSAWIAAHSERRLSKQEILQTSIEEVINAIQKGKVPELALRTSSHIILGLSRILCRKTKLLFEECSSLFIHLSKETRKLDCRVTEKKRITYKLSISKILRAQSLDQQRTDQSFSKDEIEVPRGTMMSFNEDMSNASFTLRDISLPDAVTFMKDLSFAGSKHSEVSTTGMIVQNTTNRLSNLLADHPEQSQSRVLENGNCSEIPQVSQNNYLDGNLSMAINTTGITNNTIDIKNNDDVIAISNLEKNQKRKHQRENPVTKQQKIDRNTTIDKGLLRVIGNIQSTYSQEHSLYGVLKSVLSPGHLLNPVDTLILAKQIDSDISVIHPEIDISNQNNQLDQDIIDISHISNGHPNTLQSTNNTLLNRPSYSSVEVPRNTLASHMGIDHTFNEINIADNTYLAEETIQMHKIDPITLEADLQSDIPSTKAQAFIAMLHLVSTGKATALQSHPYAPISIVSLS